MKMDIRFRCLLIEERRGGRNSRHIALSIHCDVRPGDTNRVVAIKNLRFFYFFLLFELITLLKYTLKLRLIIA